MVALVMSGGGPLAVAWEAGLLAGLAAEGVSFGQAEFVLGTSAGAIVGAQLCKGIPPQHIVDPIIAESRGIASPGRTLPFDPIASAALPDLFRRAQTPSDDPAAVRAEIGAHALAAAPESEQAGIRRFEAIVGADWPDLAFGCVVVDADDGRVAVLRRECGGPVSAAVAASCSLPGISAPVTISGRRYFDGGFASTANLDLATGYAKVLAFLFVRPGAAGPRMIETAERQADTLRQSGAEVRIIQPDQASVEAIGPNWLDVRARPRIAHAAMAQGAAAAPEIANFLGT